MNTRERLKHAPRQYGAYQGAKRLQHALALDHRSCPLQFGTFTLSWFYEDHVLMDAAARCLVIRSVLECRLSYTSIWSWLSATWGNRCRSNDKPSTFSINVQNNLMTNLQQQTEQVHKIQQRKYRGKYIQFSLLQFPFLPCARMRSRAIFPVQIPQSFPSKELNFLIVTIITMSCEVFRGYSLVRLKNSWCMWSWCSSLPKLATYNWCFHFCNRASCTQKSWIPPAVVCTWIMIIIVVIELIIIVCFTHEKCFIQLNKQNTTL